MGLTGRQAELIGQIIREEARSAYASQQERHRILEGIVRAPARVAREPGLSRGLTAAIVDLVESFAGGNRLYEGSDLDGGSAGRQASAYLARLIEADVKEVQQMLHEGDFGMDQDDAPDGMLATLPAPPGDDAELDEKAPTGGKKVRTLKKPSGSSGNGKIR